MQSSQTDIHVLKAQQRKLFISKRANIDADIHRHHSKVICERLFTLINEYKPNTVLLYAPTRGEIDIWYLYDLLIKSSIKTAFPISNTMQTSLDFRLVNSRNDLVCGAYGIYEPKQDCTHITDFTDCICLIPALCVNKHGTRLGYGKGYYDRFLSTFKGLKICAVFSDFLTDLLPSESTDIPADIICTEKEVILINEN